MTCSNTILKIYGSKFILIIYKIKYDSDTIFFFFLKARYSLEIIMLVPVYSMGKVFYLQIRDMRFK